MHEFQIDRIPPKGYLLAYFGRGLLFDAYEVSGGSVVCEGLSRFADDEMTEYHFFNRDMEYRAIFSPSRNRWITKTLDKWQEELMEPDLIYAQTVMVKKEYASREGLPAQLVIVNRYEYSAHDTLVLKNYRISY